MGWIDGVVLIGDRDRWGGVDKWAGLLQMHMRNAIPHIDTIHSIPPELSIPYHLIYPYDTTLYHLTCPSHLSTLYYLTYLPHLHPTYTNNKADLPQFYSGRSFVRYSGSGSCMCALSLRSRRSFSGTSSFVTGFGIFGTGRKFFLGVFTGKPTSVL